MPTLPGIDLATLFDAVADSVYLIDPVTSGIVWCNRIAYESLGYEPAEILGHSVLSLQMDVTGLPAWQQIADEIRKTNPYVFLGRHRHKLGHEVSVEILTRTFDMGGQSWFLSVARDITQRMALEADQLSRDEHVQFALNEASDGIWDWHLPTGEVRFSPQLKRMLGYGPHEMPPTVETWSTAVHPDDADAVFQAINQHLQGQRERYEAEYRLRNRNGHYLWVHDRGRVCQRDATGQPVRVVGMVQNITDQKALQQQLMRQASHDALTGLRNRHESEHTFESLAHTCKRLDVPLGVCIFDLDHFKQINDLQGHLAGDVVLTRVAAKVAASVRASDSLFRWGGEEFLLLCPGIGLAQLTQLVDKLRKEIEALTWPELHGLQTVTASFGLAVMPDSGQTPRELTLAADTALYQAKAAGRNCVVAHGQVARTDTSGAAPPRVVTLAAATAAPTAHPQVLLAEIQRLTQRERQLAQLLHSALDAVVAMNDHGCITEWNPGAERLLGWAASEVLGRPLEDVVVPPEHRDGHRLGLQRYLRDRTPRMLSRLLEVEAMRKDGTRLPAELSVWPIDTGEGVSFGAFLRDITERKLAQGSLQQTAERYRQVVENLGEGMGIIQNGVTVYVNPRAAQLLRRTPESMLGRSFLEWVHPDDQPLVAERHARRQAGEAVPERYELRCLTGDGEARWMSTRASALVWEGAPATMTFFADVTDQRLMIEALHRSEERYRQVIEHVGEGMVVVKGEQFVFANSRASEIVEMPVSDMLARGYLERIHPDDHALVQQRRMKRLAGEVVPNRYEIRLQMPDGRVKWIDIGVTLVPWDGGTSTLTFFSDVSERKLLEDKLTATLAEREIVLNTSVVGIAFLTPEGRFRWANPAMLNLFGGDGQDHFHSMEQVYLNRQQYLEVGGAVAKALSKGEMFQRELQMRRLDGNTIWVSLSGQAVNHNNLLDGTVWTALDITDRKHAEEGIRMALAQQRELNDLRTRFVSMTSHEFRTPLATILSSAELLRFYGERMDASERQDVLQSIEAGVQRMTTMLDSVLVLGRAEAQMMTFAPRAGELGPLCQAMLDEALQATDASLCEVALQVSPDLPAGQFDHTLLRHVFGNLLSNAIKYSPTGGRVTFDVRLDEGGYVLSVADQGIGIPSDELPHLFSSFHRASNVGDIKGTGLGLAIVKHAVELHGGNIAVTSQPGQGSCFTVRLPL